MQPWELIVAYATLTPMEARKFNNTREFRENSSTMFRLFSKCQNWASGILRKARYWGLAFLMVASGGFVVRAQQSAEAAASVTPLPGTDGGFTRELSADRPDKTDCPFTVEPGHFQLEVDMVNFTFDTKSVGDQRSKAYQIAPLNYKIGLLTNVDFQLVLTPWASVRTTDKSSGATEKTFGFGDVTPRVKVNLVGNDGGFFALAIIPFVKLPTSGGQLGNGSLEGGLGVPFSFDIPGWDVGFQTSCLINRNSEGEGYHTEYSNSVSVGHALLEPLSLAAEFFSNISTVAGSPWVGTVDSWLTLQVNNNLRLDGGVYVGVTTAADDWHPWIGLAWRF